MAQLSGMYWNNPFEAKDNFLFIAALLTKKEAQCFVNL